MISEDKVSTTHGDKIFIHFQSAMPNACMHYQEVHKYQESACFSIL